MQITVVKYNEFDDKEDQDSQKDNLIQSRNQSQNKGNQYNQTKIQSLN